eukprot:CAMPEP_0172647840 /NCGR_PEP_ID=MMETSP1068-20121228/240953_1 /TAXON_ID=35684 /ORGANISM="Pseudopedinella elastica, Strain CCMP716" /LENGTH=91 /DNA_ID=CAMNT_0013462129 /DNA_START=430 /DNA_END=705 /DNA_ORIENTATION=-
MKNVMSTAQRYHNPAIPQHHKVLIPLTVDHAAYKPSVRLGTQQVKHRGNRRGLASGMKLVMSTAQWYHDPKISLHRKILLPLAGSHAAYEP